MTSFQLRALRLNKGLSMSALAREVGLSPPTIAEIEKGETPRPATAYKIASYWDLEVLDLWPELAQDKEAA